MPDRRRRGPNRASPTPQRQRSRPGSGSYNSGSALSGAADPGQQYADQQQTLPGVPTFPVGVVIGDEDGVASPVLDYTAPAEPTGLAAVTGANENVVYFDVTWDLQDDAASYQLQWRKVGEAEWVSVRSIDNTVRVLPVEPGEDYEFQVQGVSWAGVAGEFIAAITETAGVDATVPAQVAGVSAIGGIELILATWTRNTEADISHYEVQLAVDAGFGTPTTFIAEGAITTISPLPAGTYYIRVRAVDRSGNQGDWSASDSDAALEVVDGIGPGDITETEIADDSISTPKLQALAVEASKIAADAVIASKIAAGAVETAKLDADAVTAEKLAAIELEVGKYIESFGYTANEEGWHIDADGDAEFNDVAIRGRLRNATVNVIPNDDFEVDDADWKAQDGAVRWGFDAGTESWNGTGASLTHETSKVYKEPGALRFTANSTSDSVNSPAGLSAVPTTPGTLHRLVCLISSDTEFMAVNPQLIFYDAAGVFIGLDSSNVVQPSGGLMGGLSNFGVYSCEGTAPALTAYVGVYIEFDNIDSSATYIIDEVALTTATNAAIARSTAESYEGSASLEISSLAAGVTMASSPDVVSGGYPVTAGEFLYFSCRYQQADGKEPLFIPGWLDGSDVLIGFGTRDIFAAAGTSDWQAFNTTWEVPAGAEQLVVIVGFIASASSQELYVDRVVLREASRVDGAVWTSEEEAAGGMVDRGVAYLEAASGAGGLPSLVTNGHVRSRPIFGRLTTPTGAQSVSTGSWQTVTLNTVEEALGLEVGSSGGSYYLIVPRNGIYCFGGQVNFNGFLGLSGGRSGCAVERWSADGSTLIKRYVAQAHYDDGSATAVCLSFSLDGRANRGERILLRVFQDHGSSINIEGGAGSFGGEHVLSMSYIGDV
jgi:hypothetical protein